MEESNPKTPRSAMTSSGRPKTPRSAMTASEKPKIWIRERKLDSRSWKCSQFFILALAAVCGLLSTIFFGDVLRAFGNNCFLYSNLPWRFYENTSIIELQPKSRYTWFDSGRCNFVLFAPVVVTIYAILMAWFYAMCKRGGLSSYEQPWKIVFPSFIVSSILAVFSFVGSYFLSSGIQVFCGTLETRLNLTCYEAQYYVWKDFPKAYGFYEELLVVQVLSWVCFACWVASTGVSILRCYVAADFEFMGTECSVATSVANKSGGSDVDETQQMVDEEDDEIIDDD